MRITDQHIETLVRQGYVVVPGFLTPDELTAARADMLKYFPTPQELAATPNRYGWIFDDPEHLQIEFPFAADALNHNSTHPEIISFVERLLGTREILLSQSAIWAKYAGTGSFEQTMHLDYEGNTLVVPRDDGPFRQVNLILYYSDVTPEMGPTGVVPQTQTQDAGVWPPFRPRKKYPDLYKNERPILANAGSLLIFSMRTFHRAGEITAEQGARFTHHLVYRSSLCPFNGYHQYSQFGEKPEMRQFIQRATPRQREMVGFPAPRHRYWNEHTLAEVAARYPKMDMSPYRTAAGLSAPSPSRRGLG
ncbi:MAG TPA: phytanoyl-CoA dioxygenase family protein [Tepidisphaeraceae bacterium]|nr:phytanoyl-CoA dioxygenase family protein [Tepidisphaeraceae bacterium]